MGNFEPSLDRVGVLSEQLVFNQLLHSAWANDEDIEISTFRQNKGVEIDFNVKHKNILSAVITSAAGIDATTRAKVMELVKATTTGEVELTEKIDKDLIGGFVIKIGDNQVDASVSRTLNDLRKNFSENPFVKEF